MSQLTLEQRYKIETLHGKNFKLEKIGDFIGKDKSVISREISRNKNLETGVYTAELAQKKYESRQTNKEKKKYLTNDVKSFIISKLDAEFSPEQIVGIAKENGVSCVSHERIYQMIWAS